MKLLVLATSLLVLSVLQTEACNSANDRVLCASLNRRCSETKTPMRSSLDTLKALNQECHRRLGEKWHDLPLCDVVRGICELAIIQCRNITCSTLKEAVKKK